MGSGMSADNCCGRRNTDQYPPIDTVVTLESMKSGYDELEDLQKFRWARKMKDVTKLIELIASRKIYRA
jgi:hypothetical protein